MSEDKQTGDKQPDGTTSLFQKEMAKTNTFSRNYQASRFNRYDQGDKPRATKSPGQYMSTDAPGCAAIDQTDQGESVLFVRSGLQRKVIKHLKRGDYPCQSALDLHGMRIHEAETLLSQFLSEAIQQNLSCVLIIHGKGYHSENRKGVLKPFTINRLKQCAEIKAFCSANPKDGGSGAVYVLLKRGLSTE
ncbi:Smr/MutS family protein [Candidatus Spongiihabitans sp.]|uniref:Smr/MutS family protein n=1 Tax=Candidatus Spongiihabitans sp. TaxID=3101308 RepID=UPI003C6ECE7E